MTKRFLYNKTWAQDGVKTDPDLDTTDPSYIADRYANVGWKAEKPPEQWQNFLSNLTDEKFANNLISLGVPAWESHNLLKNGALSYSLDYSAIRIGVGGTGWDATVSGTSSGYTSVINSLQNKYNTHTKATNPHNDTVDNIVGGTYLSKDVDSWFGSQTDNRTIVWHKLQTGAVHKETPAQVGTLPSTGGTFTGPVIFSKILYIKDTNFSADLWSSPALDVNPVVRFFNNGNQFYLTDDGRVYSRISSVNYQWLSESLFPEFIIESNPRFAEPQAALKANFEYSCNDGNSIGSWYVTSESALKFHTLGGLDISEASLLIHNFTTGSSKNTHRIVGRKADGTLVCRVVTSGRFVSNPRVIRTDLDNLGCEDIMFLVSFESYTLHATAEQIANMRFV